MKRQLVTSLTLASMLAIVPGAQADETINFEGLTPGSIIGQVFSDGGAGPVVVKGTNPMTPVPNAAMIFDSSNPTGEDEDLGTPNTTCPGGGPGIGSGGVVGAPNENCTALGNVLIVTEDFDGTDPDDLDLIGAKQRFDFSALGTVTIKSMTIIDVEADEPSALVELFAPGGATIAEFPLPQTGNNGVATTDFGPTAGVEVMRVTINGSGALDNIVFTVCGNGVREGNEQCDGSDAEACPEACTAECTCEDRPYCGDGNVDPGEECDDGNNEDGDGCSSSCEVEREGEGCTPGYWKQPHHFDSWVSYSIDDLFNTVFGTSITFNATKCGASDPTLLQALNCRGGGRNALARHATAALLNAADGDVDFGYDVAGVIMIVKDAVASGDHDEITAAKDLLAGLNEQGCPLN